MKGLLVHIGADTTTLGVVAPIFPDDTFEYIPINEIYGLGIKTYQDIPVRNTKYGRTLADFLPSDLARLPVHLDPNFDNFTYGEPFKEQPKFWTLMKLAEGDLIFFIASLAPYNPEIYEKRDALLRSYQVGRRDKYVVGFFKVKGIAEVYVMKIKPRLAYAMLNIYVLLEEGVSPLDLKSLRHEVKRLKEYGYITERNGSYEFTEEGLRIIDGLLEDLSGRTESEQYELLEKGTFEVEQLVGEVAEEDIKGNQHY
jgi:hypothetical protein